ncbi:alpha-hydroxy-acid oxidizing protein [Streptomyces sp. INA 01156]
MYACPFAIHDAFLAGNIREPGGFARVWRESELFRELREPQTGGACASCAFYDTCKGGCMAAKFFTGLPLDGPIPNASRATGSNCWPSARRAATTSRNPPATTPTAPHPHGGGDRWTSPHPPPGPRPAARRLRRAPPGRDGPGGTRPSRRLTRQGGASPPRPSRRPAPSCTTPSPRASSRSIAQPQESRTMRRNPWFETVAEAQRRAKKYLPSTVYGALVAGSERGRTLDDNTGAFAELGFAPRVVGHHAERDLSTTVLGVPSALPVVISPTGVQAVHPDGEVAVARAAANRGVIMGLSSFASKPVEEVAEAHPNVFYQMYWTGTREAMVQRMERARSVGAKALIATLDWSFSHGRDWAARPSPRRSTSGRRPGSHRTSCRARAGCGPSSDPAGSRPDHPQPPAAGREGPDLLRRLRRMDADQAADLGRHRVDADGMGGPFLLKGVTRVDDALRAVDAGVSAISVSNHGGNNLDTTPATIRLLPAIADAVGHDIEVLLDGGIRRGGDVAKALALGARAVLVGRAYLWGLAANGQAGWRTSWTSCAAASIRRCWASGTPRCTTCHRTTSSSRTASPASRAPAPRRTGGR